MQREVSWASIISSPGEWNRLGKLREFQMTGNPSLDRYDTPHGVHGRRFLLLGSCSKDMFTLDLAQKAGKVSRDFNTNGFS